ncbi:MAG: hypothetical protein M3Z75_28275 [Actinomycetota bacterium]|nr:hypothetical protein [Actinomycetota bacterium]
MRGMFTDQSSTSAIGQRNNAVFSKLNGLTCFLARHRCYRHTNSYSYGEPPLN